MFQRIRVFSVFMILAAVGVLGGCAAPAKVTSMTSMAPGSQVVNNNSPLKGKLEVASVVGGEDTNPMWTSEIDNASFKLALEDSLKYAGLLVAGGNPSEYQLDVHLRSVDQPMVGFSMTVTVVAEYKLYRAGDRSLVWSDQFSTPYTAQMGDAFLGTKRLQLANEGSARANIKMLIDELLRLDMPAVQVNNS